MIGLTGIITDNKEFGNDTSFIGLIYLYELRKLDFIKYKRINFFISEADKILSVFGENSNVCNVVLPYDLQKYFALKTEMEKSDEILRLFDVGFMFLCEKLNWDKELFLNIKKTIIEKKFKIGITIGKRRGNKENDEVFASLIVYPEMKKYKYYVNFEKNENVFCSLLIYEGMPDWIYWERLFKLLKWAKNNIDFLITDDNKEVSFKCQYRECKLEVLYAQHGRSLEEIGKTLKFWHWKTSEDERQRLGIPQKLL